MRHVLNQRRQLRPSSGEANRCEGMINDDSKELNIFSISMIRLHLVDNTYIMVLDCDSPEKLWTKL